MAQQSPRSEILQLTAKIVSSYLSHNSVPSDALVGLIQHVFACLSALEEPSAEVEKLQPAVPVKKSVQPDYIVCLEDGKKLKILRRYLKTAFNMTPEQYRERWGLPSDYPMVAPSYAKHRSSLAKQIGLGTKARVVA